MAIPSSLHGQSFSICWLRRDLRLFDNPALYHALQSGTPVLCLFIFDKEILDQLPSPHDRRVDFIHRELGALKKQLENNGSSLLVIHGNVSEVFLALSKHCKLIHVYANADYEPYGRKRDQEVARILKNSGSGLKLYNDHIIFHPEEVLKQDGKPYQVFTPYSRVWKQRLQEHPPLEFSSENLLHKMMQVRLPDAPMLKELGFQKTDLVVPSREIELPLIRDYDKTRNFPAVEGTSRLGIHLRFGTVSIRHLVKLAWNFEPWLNELIWREFFIMILYHYPRVVQQCFKEKYELVAWRNNHDEFLAWCEGRTGYALVDAGMRQLNQTGWMHNRVRMVTASFLTKHLLTDWRWGEAYFAEKLIDYELASNNGNWQWAAGCGCDAAPYFRIFNPLEQAKKFDPDKRYIKKWIPEYQEGYLREIVEHRSARERALRVYAEATR